MFPGRLNLLCMEVEAGLVMSDEDATEKQCILYLSRKIMNYQL